MIIVALDIWIRYYSSVLLLSLYLLQIGYNIGYVRDASQFVSSDNAPQSTLHNAVVICTHLNTFWLYIEACVYAYRFNVQIAVQYYVAWISIRIINVYSENKNMYIASYL